MRSRRTQTAFLSAVIHTIGSLGISQGQKRVTLKTDNLGIKTIVDDILYGFYKSNSVYDYDESQIEIAGDYVERLLLDCRILVWGSDGETHYEAGIDEDILTDPQAISAYLRGVFLGCGSISIIKGYHLEFALSNSVLASDTMKLLNSLQLKAKTIEHNNKTVVYIKDAEIIGDVLAMLGATKAVLKLADTVATRSVTKVANSRLNCDMANIDKTVMSAEKQLASIQFLKNNGMFCHLDSKLQDACLQRELNPTDSLSMLSQKAGISKSGLRHRLDKIVSLATQASKENS